MEDIHSRLELRGLFNATMGILAILLSIFNQNIRQSTWIESGESEITFRPSISKHSEF